MLSTQTPRSTGADAPRRNPTHHRFVQTPILSPEKKGGGLHAALRQQPDLPCLALLDTHAHVYALCLPAVLPCLLGGIESRKPRAVDAATSTNPRRGGASPPMR